uniref:WGS project CBMG000000000 data, contig CS5907-c002328 n=1 Tax=Fusarium acuminatum CS5907 TaxID=1318461 RepID=A0A090M9L7_9HYPO|nr:unnamed protein product [Fusarium acuminatum CS5907]
MEEMEDIQRQLGRVGSRLSDILVLPLEAVEIAGQCRDQLTGQLRDWLCFPPLSFLFQVRFSAEQFVGEVCGTLRLERARASVTLVDKKETDEEARTRRKTVYESLVPKPWGFLTGQEEKDVGGVPVLRVRLRVDEVFGFQCLLMLIYFYVFVRKIIKMTEELGMTGVV